MVLRRHRCMKRTTDFSLAPARISNGSFQAPVSRGRLRHGGCLEGVLAQSPEADRSSRLVALYQDDMNNMFEFIIVKYLHYST